MHARRLSAGVAVCDITPPVGYRLFGHAARKGSSDRVHDPLRLKALTLSDGRTRLAIITCDLIGFSPASVENIRRLARARCGLRPEHLMLACSHTHTGPCMSPDSTLMPREHILPEYITCVEKKVVGAIIEAMGCEAPAALSWAEGQTNIGAISRRKMTEKGLQFAPNPSGPRDDVVNLLRVNGKDGKPRALLLRYSCHPTVLGTTLCQISGDYPAAAQCEIERALPCATAMFIQGCCGDVRPALYKGEQFIGGTFGDVARMGGALAATVLKLSKRAKPLADCSLAGASTRVPLRFDRALEPAKATLAALSRKYARENEEFAQMGYIRKWTQFWRKALAAGTAPAKSLPMEMQALRLGNVTILGLAAEVMAEYGPWLRHDLGGKVLVAGYANGELGYLPTRQALAQGGYEAVYHLFENYPAPYAARVEKDVLAAARALDARLRRSRG